MMDVLLGVYTCLVLLAGVMIASYTVTANAKTINLQWTNIGHPNYPLWIMSHRIEIGDVIVFYYEAQAHYHMHRKQGNDDESSTWPSPHGIRHHGSKHNIWQFHDGQSFAACQFAEATLVDDGTSGRGSFAWRAPYVGTFYFGCSVQDDDSESHCSSGNQQIRITVMPKMMTASAVDLKLDLSLAPTPAAGGPIPFTAVRGPALTPAPTSSTDIAPGPVVPSPPPTLSPALVPVSIPPAAAASAPSPNTTFAPAPTPELPSPAPTLEGPAPAPALSMTPPPPPPPPPPPHHPPPPPVKHNHSVPAPAPSPFLGPPAPPLETPEPLIYAPDVSPAAEPTSRNAGVGIEVFPWRALLMAAAAAVFAA